MIVQTGIGRTRRNLVYQLSKLNWNSPIVILIAIVIPFAFYSLGSIFNIGITLGIMMAISILTLYKKLPRFIKNISAKFPLMSDMLFTIFATIGVAGVFGTGLTLGIAAVVCDLILTWAMPKMHKD